jgi:hypothetical protein
MKKYFLWNECIQYRKSKEIYEQSVQRQQGLIEQILLILSIFSIY